MRQRRDADRLKSELEELFADLCQVPRLVAPRKGFRPAVDVYRTENPPTITIVVELAGIEAEDTELSFGDGVLVVRGRRRRPADPGRRYQHMEIDHGPFERRIAIADPVDADAVEATYDRGLLVIALTLAERPTKPVHVRINAARQP